MLERKGLQIAALSLLLTGGAAVGAQANRDNRLEPIPPLPPPPPTEITINDEEAGLSCTFFTEKPEGVAHCEFTILGNPVLQLTTLDILNHEDETVLFILGTTAIPSVEIGVEIDNLLGMEINKEFGFNVNMDVEMIGYEIDPPGGGYSVGQFPVTDGFVNAFSGEVFQLPSLPKTIMIRNSDGVEIGRRNVKERVDIFIENNLTSPEETTENS